MKEKNSKVNPKHRQRRASKTHRGRNRAAEKSREEDRDMVGNNKRKLIWTSQPHRSLMGEAEDTSSKGKSGSLWWKEMSTQDKPAAPVCLGFSRRFGREWIGNGLTNDSHLVMFSGSEGCGPVPSSEGSHCVKLSCHKDLRAEDSHKSGSLHSSCYSLWVRVSSGSQLWKMAESEADWLRCADSRRLRPNYRHKKDSLSLAA